MDKPPPAAPAEASPRRPSPTELAEWQVETGQRQMAAVARVDRLVRDRTDLAEELHGGLGELKAAGARLDELEARSQSTGLIQSISRALGRRSAALERRSVAGQLLAQYETVTASLQRASAFTDELQLCARELQHEVDGLHERIGHSRQGATLAARKVLEIEAELEALQQSGAAAPGAARRRDQLRFDERTESTTLALFRAAAELAQEELGPARALRDTVLELHGDMARFVLEASSAVNTSGRRVQALGLAADTPLVVTELHEALRQLDQTMDATAAYIDQAHALLTQVLPELNREIRARTNHSHLSLADDLEGLSRERQRELADQALREAAEAEVGAFLDSESG